MFALVVYAGYEGVAYYTANFDPTFIFVIFWVGVPVSSVLLGNWFSAFSPWRAFARGLRWLSSRFRVEWRPPFSYPAWLGRWPVVAGLLGFGWLELVYHDHDNPTLLASLARAEATGAGARYPRRPPGRLGVLWVVYALYSRGRL